METDILTKDKDFLEQSLKFYRNIDKYSSILGVDQGELASFKNDLRVFLFIADKRYQSFSEDFVRYNIMILRRRVEHLFIACTNSQHYTKKIGEELGITTRQHRIWCSMGWNRKDEPLNALVSPELK